LIAKYGQSPKRESKNGSKKVWLMTSQGENMLAGKVWRRNPSGRRVNKGLGQKTEASGGKKFVFGELFLGLGGHATRERRLGGKARKSYSCNAVGGGGSTEKNKGNLRE